MGHRRTLRGRWRGRRALCVAVAAVTDFASLAGGRVMSLHVTMPTYGRWAADVVLATSEAIPAVATPLVIGDLTLLGTAIRMASFAGSRSARMVGGYGGWHKSVPAQEYVGANVRVSTVLRDAATAVGERVAIDVADAALSRYAREAGPAARALRQIAGPQWYVSPDGVTHVGPRPGGAVASEFTVIHWSGARGSFQIATETLADWLPGRTFTAPTVSGTHTVSYTEIEMTNAGKLRLEVLA